MRPLIALTNRIHSNMAQPDVRIEQTTNGKLRFHFGESRGHKDFDTRADLRAYVLPWIATRIQELSRTMSELARVQRSLIGPAPLGEILDKDE